MTTIEDRTCAEVRPRKETQFDGPVSAPLSSFRSESAYVLLGDPGLGKSTAFRSEHQAQGETSILLDARDFLVADLAQHQEWLGKTLFIDGLDEVRVGSADVRSALDEIRNRLDALGRPRFRISCREADWLGNNDRNRLEFVSQDSTVRILRLDPLSDAEIEQILSGHPSVSDPRSFIDTARQRGVSALLANPQTLNMLAEVAGGGEQWPQSRRDTFDRACRIMARETNEEHAIGSPQPPLDEILYAAGHMSAAQLITGSAGFSLDPGDGDYLPLAGLGDIPMNAAKAAVSTRLFRSVGDRRFAPIHRHIAEFLGAHHLAGRINAGLSARRIISLISGADGIVVTEMRGLSGWLAALCPQSRDLLTDRDPVGVALYGDLSVFSTVDKRNLMEAIGSRDALLPLRLDARSREMETALAPLTSDDMEPTLVEILSNPSRDPEHQSLVHFLLSLLSRGVPLPNLAPQLLGMAKDESRWPYVRTSAVDALIQIKSEPEQRTEDLKSLLDQITAGTISDPNSEMKGVLLSNLYPRDVPAGVLWGYLTERSNPQFFGMDTHFWGYRLVEQSSDQDVADLLDELLVRHADVWSALKTHHADEVPLRLLARGLSAFGDDLPLPRLYQWLSAAAPPQWGRHSPDGDSVAEVRDWLGRRPEIQQALVLHGLSCWPQGKRTIESEYQVYGPLHGHSPAANLGAWCLDQAVRLAPSQPEASEFLFDEAFLSYGDNGVPLEDLRSRISGVEVLEERLSLRLQPPPPSQRTRASERQATWEAKHERERQQGIEYVRQHAVALRQNRAPLALLRDIGRAYFFYPASEVKPLAPIDRVAHLLDGDDDLVKAALAGLRGSLWRSEVPPFEEILRLSEESRQHFLAYPVQAALDLLQQESSERLLDLNESQIRTALAFYYCTPGSFSRRPAWHENWAKLRPEIVAAVATETAIAALRRKDSHSPALYALADMVGAPDLKHQALLKVLSKFPLRARLESLRTLDFLLWNLLDHPERAALLHLIDSKSSTKSMSVAQRVRWLAAGVVAAAEQYIERLTDFVRAEDRRARHLTGFFDAGDPFESDGREFTPATLGALIELMGPAFAPDSLNESGAYTLEMKASRQIERFIQQLGAMPGEDATQALAALTTDLSLSRWTSYIERARDDQRILHREATYSYPDLEQLHRVLDNGEPANASDLAALVIDRLATIATDIRSSNANVWRQYWNEESHRRPRALKHEDSCRDALLTHLRRLLPLGVDAQPEGHYVGDKRSDIRVACSDFNVPVEIKKVTHRDMWSALRAQLIDRYTRDADTSGYGIYLVLWFPGADMPPPPTGTRPTTPRDLEDRLKQTLTDDEARKIAVIVLDVSPVL